MTHKDYFRFLNRINEILSEYDVSELEAFYRISRSSFPHMASILRELVYMARRGSKFPTVAPEKTSTVPSERERLSVIDILNSKRVFPSNRDLGEYASRSLGIRVRWEHDSRSDLARRILSAMRSIPSAERSRALEELRSLAAQRGVPLSSLDESSFFQSWERIIKEQSRPNG